MEENNTINLNNVANSQPNVNNTFVNQQPQVVVGVDTNNSINYNDLYNQQVVTPNVENSVQAGDPFVYNTPNTTSVNTNTNESVNVNVQTTTQPEVQTAVNVLENKPVDVQPSTPVNTPNNTMVKEPIGTYEQVNTNTERFKLKTETLANMVNNAKKAAICEDRLITTTIMQLMFSTTGFKIISTDATNTLIQEDTSIKFNRDEKICVEAELFTKLVNKLDTEEVELEYEPNSHVINVIANGTFKLSEIYDVQTGQPIEIITDDVQVLPTDTVKTINLDNFKDILQRANTFAGNGNIYAFLSGIYCKDKVYSTDRVCMFGSPNIPELQDESMYLSQKFVSLLLQLSFDGNVSFIIRKDESNTAKAVIIKDSKTTLYGPVDEFQADYPVETIVSYMNQQLSNEFKVNKNELLSILDKAELFIENNSSNQSCIFKISSLDKKLKVATVDYAADQNIPIEGINLPDRQDLLRIRSMLKSLKNCDDEVITIQTDPNNKTGIKIISDNIIQVVAYTGEE